MNSIHSALKQIEQHAYTYHELEKCVRAQSFNDVKMRFVSYQSIPKTGITKEFFFKNGANCVAILFPLTAAGNLVYHWGGLMQAKGKDKGVWVDTL